MLEKKSMSNVLIQLAEEVYLETETLPFEEYHRSLIYVAVNSKTLDLIDANGDLTFVSNDQMKAFKGFDLDIVARVYTTFDGSCYVMVYFTIDETVPTKKACIRRALR